MRVLGRERGGRIKSGVLLVEYVSSLRYPFAELCPVGFILGSQMGLGRFGVAME